MDVFKIKKRREEVERYVGAIYLVLYQSHLSNPAVQMMGVGGGTRLTSHGGWRFLYASFIRRFFSLVMYEKYMSLLEVNQQLLKNR